MPVPVREETVETDDSGSKGNDTAIMLRFFSTDYVKNLRLRIVAQPGQSNKTVEFITRFSSELC